LLAKPVLSELLFGPRFINTITIISMVLAIPIAISRAITDTDMAITMVTVTDITIVLPMNYILIDRTSIMGIIIDPMFTLPGIDDNVQTS
jgi:hypothetical protein